MAWSIIKDEEQKVAALICVDPPCALGPTAAGDNVEEAVNVLEEFVKLLGAPPDEMPFAVLWDEWRNYIDAIVQVAEGIVEEGMRDLEAAKEAEDRESAGDSNGAESAGAAVSGAETPPGGGQEAPGDDPGVDRVSEHAADEEEQAAEEELDVTPEQLADRLKQVPGGTPAQRGRAVCWLCDGAKEIEGPNGRVTCPTCKGLGETNEDGTPVQTTTEVQ